MFKLHEICTVDSQKIIKIVATRSPDPLVGFEGLLPREERGGKSAGEERGGEGGKGGEEAFLVMWPRKLSALNPRPWKH